MSYLNPLLHLEALLILSIISAASLKFRFMDWKGVAAAFPVGYLIYVFGGRGYFLILIIFYSISSAATRFRIRRLREVLNRESGVRSWKNVVSNGLVATTAAVMAGITGGASLFFAAYLGAIASAFADTLATEIGLLYPGMPRLITNMRRVRRGTPGAVSSLGYLGGLLGLGILTLTTIPLKRTFSAQTLATMVCISGLVGMTVDSILGAMIQAKYRCVECGKEVEISRHCRREAKLIGGFRPIDTHAVNLISTLVGAILAVLILNQS